MRKQTLCVQYSTPKYKALEYYLEKQNKKIENMLAEHLEDIYKEQVQKDVQEYVKLQNPDDEEQKDNQPTRRQSSRMTAEEVTDTPVPSGPKLSM